MSQYFPRRSLLNHERLLAVFVFCAFVLGLSTGSCVWGQDNTSFSQQTYRNADEASATFIVRPGTNRKPLVFDDQSFTSGDGTPVSVVELPARFPESGVRQPYRTIDQAFYDYSRPETEKPVGNPGVSVLIPQSTYSYDSREWVEMYPTAGRSEWDLFSSNQVTPALGVPTQRTTTDVPAMTSVTAPKVASNVRIENTPGRQFDLSPNPIYAKHLKHTDVCGGVVVQSNFPLTEIKQLLDEIALLQRDLNQYMAVPAPKEKIELCLFKDEASYIRFLKDVFPKAPLDRRALYVKETGKPGVLLVQRTKDFEVDLRHEMTHAIIHASIANVPIWLDEGLAKYFEPVPDERSAMNPYLKPIRFNVKIGIVPYLSRLEKLEFIGEMGSREYRDSWAWVHFLIHHSPQTHRMLAGYLQLLATLPETASDPKKKIEVPPISFYLEDVVKQPREKYLEHFKTWAVVKDE